MSQFAAGLVSGIALTVFVEYGVYLLALYILRRNPRPEERDESMKRHLDELYQDIDRGKMP